MARDREGGRMGRAGREAARRAYEKEQASQRTAADELAEESERQSQRACREATELIESILPGVELDDNDWEIGSAYWSSDGGGGSYSVLTTEIDGVAIMVVIGHGPTTAYHGSYEGYEEYPEAGAKHLTQASFWEALDK